jgi:hypothetical protein
MRTIKKEFAALTNIKLETLFSFPKKEMDSNLKSIFFSVKPACSLRFPIAATQVKALEYRDLVPKPKTMTLYDVKSYSKIGQRFLGIYND